MNVLTITGFKKKWLEEAHDVEEAAPEPSPKRWYNNIPCRIIKKEDLGRTVKARCWFCDIDFTGVEVFYPKVICTDGSFSAEGQFNSFKCLISYCNLYYNRQTDWSEAYNKCLYLYRLLHPGADVVTIPPAPSKYFRSIYGGTYTDEEYLEELDMSRGQPCLGS